MKKSRAVLVISEDQTLWQELERTLLAASHQVQWSPDLSSAWQKAQEQDTDVILLDEMMCLGVEGINGLLYLRRLLPQVPVVLMSSSKNQSMVYELLSVGAIQHWVIKPFLEFKLLHVLETVSARSPSTETAPTIFPSTLLPMERRNSIRLQAKLPIAYCFFNDKAGRESAVVKGKSNTKNLSLRGLQLETDPEIIFPNFVELELFIPTVSPIRTNGQIVWTQNRQFDGKRRHGIKFYNLKEKHLVEISDFLSSSLKNVPLKYSPY